jgi:hypothetical protein
MSDPSRTPTNDSGPQPDPIHQRGETGNRNQRTPKPENPAARDLPGDVPGATGIDDVHARMVPRSNAAGGTGAEGRTTEGVSGGEGLPGGTAPHDDDREERRV